MSPSPDELDELLAALGELDEENTRLRNKVSQMTYFAEDAVAARVDLEFERDELSRQLADCVESIARSRTLRLTGWLRHGWQRVSSIGRGGR